MSSLASAGLPPEFSISSALDEIDRADSAVSRVRAAAAALHQIGFDRVVITLRDLSLNVTHLEVAGRPEADSTTSHALTPLPGAVWRRRLAAIERYRIDGLFMLEGGDAWVAREFFGTNATEKGNGTSWLPTDLIVAFLCGAEGELLGIVKLADPRDRLRPDSASRRDISAIARHLSARLAYDGCREVAQKRAARLQRLQEAGAALARTLDETEIVRELARQAMRATGTDGVTIAAPNLDDDTLSTSLCIVRGKYQTRPVCPLGDGIVAEAARTGKPVRIGDREADRARKRAGLETPLSMYDVVGDEGIAASVLAVPMLVNIQLVGVLVVHAVETEVFGAEDEEMLATMASQAATAIANARRYDESERERRQTEALAEVARAVGESLRLGEVLRLILRHAVALLGAEGANIALRNDEYLHIVAAVGASEVLAGMHLPVRGSLLGKALLDNELVVSNDFLNESQRNRSIERFASVNRMVIVPLIAAGDAIGVISVINREREFDVEDARILQRLADHVAVAIVNARLFEEVERATREWKIAFDGIASGIVVVDENGVVKRCNARAAELCHKSIATLLGTRFRTSLPMASSVSAPDGVDTLLNRAMQEGVPVSHLLSDETRERLFELSAVPHPDGGCVVTFVDVSGLHRLAEQHLRVLETVSEAIVISNLDRVVTFANRAAYLLFRREVLIGESVSALTPPPWRSEVERRAGEARSGATQRYRCRILCGDGEERDVAVSTAAQFELGEVTGTVACIRELSDGPSRFSSGEVKAMYGSVN